MWTVERVEKEGEEEEVIGGDAEVRLTRINTSSHVVL